MQESFFSKAYCPLAQHYFSAGLVWSLPWGGFLFHYHLQGEILFHYHFWGGVLFHYYFQGGPLPLPLLGVLFHHHFWGGVLFHYHFLGGPLPLPLLGGSHVTYPIMLLYTAIECPSASWAKFTWDPPPPPPELDRLTDKHD